jgi:RNA-splicing ligase RtcB
MILRKGAVSACAGEKLLIPMNMRDGSLVCEGLGNADWNYSAPHGAGRLMSRAKAFATLRMDDYKSAMAGIYSTSVNRHTIDESPMAYKNMDDIIANMAPTVKILARIKPVYNFKAAESPRKHGGHRQKNRQKK